MFLVALDSCVYKISVKLCSVKIIKDFNNPLKANSRVWHNF